MASGSVSEELFVLVVQTIVIGVGILRVRTEGPLVIDPKSVAVTVHPDGVGPGLGEGQRGEDLRSVGFHTRRHGSEAGEGKGSDEVIVGREAEPGAWDGQLQEDVISGAETGRGGGDRQVIAGHGSSTL